MTQPHNTPLPLLRSWKGFHHQPISFLSFSPSTELLAAASHDGVLVLFAVDSGAPAAILQLDPMVIITCMHWVSINHFWMAASDGSVMLWKVVDENAKRRLILVDALPFYFPDAAHYIASEATSASCRTLPQCLLVGFGRTIEQWEHNRSGPVSWFGRGRATSIDSGDVVLAAWPLSRHTSVIVFKINGAMLWRPCDDALEEVIGWPKGQIHAAHLLHPPSDEVPKRAHQFFSARPELSSGRVILALDDQIVILSLTCSHPGPYARIVHSASMLPCTQPAISSVTCWISLPILVTPMAGCLAAFDLSPMAFQHAAASNKPATAEALLSQSLKPFG
ncbi:hypothetical protein BKA62DRAFT_770306 [Auriculariales sp. MPI-PUGE-AT-0066]|nr:hypothetical protein BKA62DRAFT_770306 [Auriculariales sp. MPI-PUGE-AT-0066]